MMLLLFCIAHISTVIQGWKNSHLFHLVLSVITKHCKSLWEKLVPLLPQQLKCMSEEESTYIRYSGVWGQVYTVLWTNLRQNKEVESGKFLCALTYALSNILPLIFIPPPWQPHRVLLLASIPHHQPCMRTNSYTTNFHISYSLRNIESNIFS